MSKEEKAKKTPVAYRIRLMSGKNKKLRGVRVIHGEIEDKIFVKLRGNPSQEQINLIEEYFKDKFDKPVVLLLGIMDMMEVERIQ